MTLFVNVSKVYTYVLTSLKINNFSVVLGSGFKAFKILFSIKLWQYYMQDYNFSYIVPIKHHGITKIGIVNFFTVET